MVDACAVAHSLTPRKETDKSSRKESHDEREAQCRHKRHTHFPLTHRLAVASYNSNIGSLGLCMDPARTAHYRDGRAFTMKWAFQGEASFIEHPAA